MTKRLLALDIGGTTIRAALIENGKVTIRAEQPTPRPALPDAVIQTALSLARPFAAQASAVGVACAGAVANGSVTATAAHTFPGWDGIALAQQLGQGLGLPCTVLNDARAAAWGEFAAGAGQGTSEFMFITVSTGVGAGLVLGHHLHLAANGLDAELGFVSVPARWQTGFGLPPEGTLKLGPLEFETSGTALGTQALAQGLTQGPGMARELCDLAEAGTPAAETLYRHSASLIAWKVADIAALLGVTRVALGGSVGLRPGYLQRVNGALAAFPARYQPQVVHAALGAEAGLIGAALWAERQG
ncbi:ROK family protein [Deinococcus sp.]|uniref:ROK family protein n=1 Tax=Deinococcus sp. TaxID=47478 RepID=UPI0025BEB08E|nr:ROK family protein [Deinococcus sp.]